MLLRYLSFAVLFIPFAKASSSCASGYTLCSPSGATSTSTPQLTSPDFRTLYTNILLSSLPSSSSSQNLARAQLPSESTSDAASTPNSLCCNALLSCLLMHSLSIPFCYDKFTTNYFLPDGSYGTVVGGSYTSSTGTANLLTGEYTLSSGEKGNIYPSDADKPNTATLSLPTQFTGTGVGSAVPANSLGREITVTYTTTLVGTTRAGSLVSARTTESVVRETILLPITVGGETIASTEVVTKTVPVTVKGSTVGGVTVSGEVRTVTTVEEVAATSTGGVKKSGGEKVVSSWMWVVLGVVVVW